MSIRSEAEAILSAASNLLETVKREHDRTTLADGEHSRRVIEEARGYLLSCRDILAGRPLGEAEDD